MLPTNSVEINTAFCAKARDEKIDILRFIGLSLIIFAHINTPGILQQLRSLEVPLMVIVSGLSFLESKIEQNYLYYVWKRIKRLVFPVWIFLTFYFLINFLFHIEPEDLNYTTIWSSYAFLVGIQYVWIIRVFLLIALTAPFLYKLSFAIQSNIKYLLLLLLSWIVYEVFLDSTKVFTKNAVWDIASLYIYYAISYSIIMALGLRLRTLTRFEVLFLCHIFLLTFVILAIVKYKMAGEPVPTLRYKYPPSVYYISYALFMCLLLWICSDQIVSIVKKIRLLESLVKFTARNSLWVYLWHILAVKCLHYQTIWNFLFTYLLVYAFAILMTWLQVITVRRIITPRIKSEIVQSNLNGLLTG